MQNVSFQETGITSQMNFIFVQFSETDSGVLSNCQFCFQANVSRRIVSEKLYVVSLHQYLYMWLIFVFLDSILY
jgi:hypothetical protein